MKKLLLLNLLLAGSFVHSQSLPVGTPLLEEALRRNQLDGRLDSNLSFMVRPIIANSLMPFDSLYYPDGLAHHVPLQKGKLSLRLLPTSLGQQINTHHPYGWNDGAMIQAKGYQLKASAGIYARWGRVSLQLQPELVWAQNASFATFPTSHTDSTWRNYYYFLNRIDNPERYGSGSYAKAFAGQSALRVHFGKFSAGLSTENLWWGPGIRNALLMSNNAPGFLHATFNTTTPVITRIGSFEGQIIAGRLRATNILPPDTGRTFEGTRLYQPKPADGDRYINGAVLTWQPRWTKGLFLGVSRMFYQYSNDVSNTLDGYLPLVGGFFKKKVRDEDRYGRDQLFSLFARLLLPESKAEFYVEWGRNDHALDLVDLVGEPEHTRAYTLGGRKIFTGTKGKQWELFGEMTHLQNPATGYVRALEGWYTHYQVRHGYTHRGQVLGAGIGPGGSSQTLGISRWKGVAKTGLYLERVVRHNDFTLQNFAPSRKFDVHWVDLSLNGTKSWVRGNFLFNAQLSLVRSINYQWRYIRETQGSKFANNIYAGFSAAYRF
ncbi:capsule assembly Wzi family protein [Paracnuella aquatica]|uniref:capsule assembly Wzi family protein n=1 Tax=Paracnuella aquatica TaxID=2268757 RepID=UPI000DEEC0B9|nr:capsule assembly Wzi family protein [Paracnuella aquatica]RPD51030.1 hypothetical protein DRJ53_05950 [Paracnuella aquatica]